MRNPGQVIGDITSNDNASFYDSYKQHFSRTEPNADVVLLESLRNLHPGRMITANHATTDPFTFAKAGFAKAERIDQGTNDVVNYLYYPETNRLTGGTGRLEERVEFGRYDYTFEDVQSIVYVAGWASSDGCNQRRYFYIAPEEDPQSQAWAFSIITASGRHNAELHDQIYVFDHGHWRKSKLLWASVKDASWEDVILDPTMKNTLVKDVSNFFESRAMYEEYGVPWKRGIILHGSPGCGKTISIKALIRAVQSLGAVSLYVKSLTSNQGTSQSVRSIFQHARQMAPCMLVFEDLDSLVVDEIRSYFLNEVDGLESNHGILMIGSTNHLERLDPGISKRPSRFDRKYHFRLPGVSERKLYCEYWQGKLKAKDDLDLSTELCRYITELTDGFSFAYLKELFVQAILAIVARRVEDPDEDVRAAVADVADNTVVDTDSSRLLRRGEKIDTAKAAAGDEPGDDGDRGSATQVPAWQRLLEADMPAHLQPNPLARVFRRQIIALRKDMDSTGNGTEEPAKEKNGEGKAEAKGEK